MYQAGECVGIEKKGKTFKGIAALMVVGLRLSISFIVRSIPEVMFNVQWLADIIKGNIDKLITIGFCVQGIVTDKH